MATERNYTSVSRFLSRIRSIWPKGYYPATSKPLPFFLGLETILLRFLVERSMRRVPMPNSNFSENSTDTLTNTD